MLKNIDLIVGARPNFIKCAMLHNELTKSGFKVRIVHTGQHYDELMSDVFFKELSIPMPDVNLNAGSGSHAVQTGNIMKAYEDLLQENPPNLTIVFGDVNSTAAVVITCAKHHIKTAHVEAGLRSFNKNMPEELNRIITDSIADYLFTPSNDADENLIKEGVDSERIFRVGNIMIDTLIAYRDEIDAQKIIEFKPVLHNYVYVTIHRPSNVDDREHLKAIIEFLNNISREKTVLFSIHPRTEKALRIHKLNNMFLPSVIQMPPLSYLKSMKLMIDAFAVITDSGGIQEETTFLGIPCFTLRNDTERPITISKGTNMLIKPTQDNVNQVLEPLKKIECEIELWDGHTSERIAYILKDIL